MLLLRYFYATSMLLLCYFYATSMLLLYYFYATSMLLLCYFYATSMLREDAATSMLLANKASMLLGKPLCY